LLPAADRARAIDATAEGREAFDEKLEMAVGRVITTRSGLKYVDLAVGTGVEVKKGDNAVVHYVGTLRDGKKFDSTSDQGRPFSFRLGAGQVIKGWDEGVAGMKVGGKRKLIIPPDLAYGPREIKDANSVLIPANSELTFEIELLKVQ
jgi:peptidylprolyl isomerase